MLRVIACDYSDPANLRSPRFQVALATSVGVSGVDEPKSQRCILDFISHCSAVALEQLLIGICFLRRSSRGRIVFANYFPDLTFRKSKLSR